MSNPLLILSLDGGGVRGVITVTFLKHLEHTIQSKYDPQFKLSSHFHLYAGTSTGALIAISLAILKPPVDTIDEFYCCDVFEKIMDKTLWDKMFDVLQRNPKYTEKGRCEVFDKILGNKAFVDTGDKLLVVPTYDVENNEAFIIRSCKASPKLLAKDVAMATSAAPAYFPTHYTPNCQEVGQPVASRWLIDGGVIANNPAMCAISDAQRHLILNNETKREIKVLSIGTGFKHHKIDGKKSMHYGGVEWLTNGIIDISMNQTVVCQQAKWILKKGNYMRVNIDIGDVDDSIDNTCDKHIEKLRQLGTKMWELHGEKTVQFLMNPKFI